MPMVADVVCGFKARGRRIGADRLVEVDELEARVRIATPTPGAQDRSIRPRGRLVRTDWFGTAVQQAFGLNRTSRGHR